MAGKKKDMSFLVGTKFHKWEVLSVGRVGSHTTCECRCACGVIKKVYYTHLKSEKSKGCIGCCKPIGKDSPYFKGVEGITADWWRSHVTRGAANRYKTRKNISILITMEQAWEQFIKQDRKCALTGLALEFPRTNSSHGTASLDRIDSSKDYALGNIQWVHKDINLMKNKLSQNRFIELCKLVAKQ